MANHALSRPEGEVLRQEPVPHDQWLPGRWTGNLLLLLETPRGQFVSPGTGRLSLTRWESGGEVVAQQVARAAGVPVIPGSGIKGAVRTIFELLSFSCNPIGHRSTACDKRSCCEACSLFGLMSWNGRASFGDAVPANPGSVRVKVERVPIPWLPRAERTRGEFRLYDLREAEELDRGRRVWVKRSKELAREVLSGELETRLSFWNVTREEMGRLLLCMGLGADDATRFALRLGGVKYDGKGAVLVRPRRLQLVAPRRRTLEEADLQEELAGCIAAARTGEWAARFWTGLEKVAATLKKD